MVKACCGVHLDASKCRPILLVYHLIKDVDALVVEPELQLYYQSDLVLLDTPFYAYRDFNGPSSKPSRAFNRDAPATAAQKSIRVIARLSLDHACGQCGIALATMVDQTNSDSIPRSNRRDPIAHTTARVVSSIAQERRVIVTAAGTRRLRRIVSQFVVTTFVRAMQLSTSLYDDSAQFKALHREGSPPFASSSWRPRRTTWAISCSTSWYLKKH
jgi:hypothetical protein